MDATLSPHHNASNIEQALSILQLADSRLPHADHFLSNARVSPAIWPVLHHLIQHTTSDTALAFAARTLHQRLKADWLTFDHNARAQAYSLAVDGAVRCAPLQRANASPVYFFGKAAGFTIARSTGDVRHAMWALLHEKLAREPLVKCHVLAALVTEIRSTKTGHPDKHEDNMTFCWDKACHVVSFAISLMHIRHESSISDLQRMRAALSCLEAWVSFGDRNAIAAALLPLITIPELSDAVSELLSQIAGCIGASPALLLPVCEGLLNAFRATKEIDAPVVHHAIAEVVCGISEWNADELMERCDHDARAIVARTAELMWLCIKSPDDRTFFTAADAWTSWVSAESFVKEGQQKLGCEQIIAVVGSVVERMQSLAIFDELTQPHLINEAENAQEILCLTGLMFQSVLTVGPASYVNALTPLVTPQCDVPPPSKCAALFALGAAGESVDVNGTIEKPVGDIILTMLARVLDLVESLYPRNGSVEHSMHDAMRFCSLKTLCAFAPVLSTISSDETLYRAVRCACTGILDKSISERAAQLLSDLTEYNPGRLVGFLKELITSSQGALTRISAGAAEACIRGLARIAAVLPSKKEKLEALDGMLASLCKRIRMTNAESKSRECESVVRRDITLVTAAIHEMNDDDSARVIFEQLQPAVFRICLLYCDNQEMSSAMCRLLEICVLPTLMDEDEEGEGEDNRKRTDAERLLLAIACADLASVCFRQSGPDGEPCWLKTLRDITGHMIFGIEGATPDHEERALRCLSGCVENAVLGLQAFCGKSYNILPGMTVAYFRFCNRLVAELGHVVLLQARNVTEVALGGLRCGDYTVAKESLEFWKLVFSPGTSADVGGTMLKFGGGPAAVTAGILCAAQMQRCSNKVADTLFALCRFVAGGEDVGIVLQGLLKSAFAIENVPKEGLDRGVREMLFRGCYCSVGSQVDFRKALQEVGRVCDMAIR